MPGGWTSYCVYEDTRELTEEEKIFYYQKKIKEESQDLEQKEA